MTHYLRTLTRGGQVEAAIYPNGDWNVTDAAARTTLPNTDGLAAWATQEGWTITGDWRYYPGCSEVTVVRLGAEVAS